MDKKKNDLRVLDIGKKKSPVTAVDPTRESPPGSNVGAEERDVQAANPLPIVGPAAVGENAQALEVARTDYVRRWGVGSEDQEAKAYLNSLPMEEQLFVYRFASKRGLRVEDLSSELLIARELHSMSTRAVANLEFAIGREHKEVAALVLKQEELFARMKGDIDSAHTKLESTLNSVLSCVAQGLDTLDKRSVELEAQGSAVVERVRESVRPEGIAREAVKHEAEEAGKLFYRKVAKEIRGIAKEEAKNEVNREWRKKGWINNATWFIFSLLAFGVGLLVK